MEVLASNQARKSNKRYKELERKKAVIICGYKLCIRNPKEDMNKLLKLRR